MVNPGGLSLERGWIRRIGAWLLALLFCAGLAACAEVRIMGVEPGSSASDLRTRVGAPNLERTLADGSRYWYYVYGFFGFTTYRVHLDSSGRVIESTQVLTEKSFRENLQRAETTRDQVLEALGPPGRVEVFPNLSEIVWTYRWRDHTVEMLADVTLDAGSGKLITYALYRDPSYASGPEQ
jgi:outer membrane protein assembly factor BamE (lipoprotein component of BamABCDE complex)